MKYVAPSIRETAFNCPHCRALAAQYWYSVRADRIDSEQRLPLVITSDEAGDHLYEGVEYKEIRDQMVAWSKRMMVGLPFLEEGNNGSYSYHTALNLNLSSCFNCHQVAVWVSDRLIYPSADTSAPEPNPDLPEEIRRDYEEASAILMLSPRGAAALIRLAIQKLCKHLGQPGKNINDDIKALVAGGLDARVQKALDAVRVIGNNAVHPGHLELTDDRVTAEALLKLLNLIADKMISEPKHVDEVYASLPESARKAIEARDKN